MIQPTIYNRGRTSKTEIKVDDIVLLKNNKRFDQKDGKFSQKWLGPYNVMNISDKGVVTLKKAWGVTLKNKYNIVQLKRYIQGADDKSKSTSNKESVNFWNHEPDEIVGMILLYALNKRRIISLDLSVRPMEVSNRRVVSGLV